MAAEQPIFQDRDYAILLHHLHRPFFFEKLARDWGIQANSPEEEQMLLETAAMLRQQKEAADLETGGNSFLKEARDALATAVTGRGGQAMPTTQDMQIKQAAAAVLQNPEVRQSVENYGAALAQEYQLAAQQQGA
jgi:hypothetical protein